MDGHFCKQRMDPLTAMYASAAATGQTGVFVLLTNMFPLLPSWSVLDVFK